MQRPKPVPVLVTGYIGIRVSGKAKCRLATTSNLFATGKAVERLLKLKGSSTLDSVRAWGSWLCKLLWVEDLGGRLGGGDV